MRGVRLPVDRASALAASVALIAGGASTMALFLGTQILFYPTLVVSAASFAYLLVRWSDRRAVSVLVLPPRVFDTVLLLGIVGAVLIPRTTPIGIPVFYYWYLVVLAGLFAIKILTQPSLLTLVYLVLLAVSNRAAIWFSAPVIGRDPRIHRALVEYVVTTGSIVPRSISYYRWYPVSHVGSAMTSLVTSAPPRHGMFLAMSLVACIGIGAVYLFTVNALDSTFSPERRLQAGLFAALVVVFAPWYIQRSASLIAQSLAIALLPFALYAMTRIDDRRYILLFVMFAVLINFTHNLTPLILVFMLVAIFAARAAMQYVSGFIGTRRSAPARYGTSLIAILGLLTVQYWIYIEYYRLQIHRIIELFFSEGDLGSASSGSAIVGTYEFTPADPFIHVGIEQLVFAAVFLLIGYLVVEYGRTVQDRLPLALSLASLVVFGGISAVLPFGQGMSLLDALRALSAVSLIVAPVFGVLACELRQRGTAGVAVVVCLLLVFPLSTAAAASYGVSNPGMSPTERTVGEVQYLTASEDAAVDHLLSEEYRSPTYKTDEYIESTATSRTLRDNHPRVDSIGGMAEFDQRTIERNMDDGSNVVLYRTVYRDVVGLSPPSGCSSPYDSGDARTFHCEPRG